MNTEPNALEQAWGDTRARRGQDAAIVAPRGTVLRTFRQIEEEAEGFERDLLRPFAPGDVLAIQIGNHASWPALLLACWRRGLVAVPLERSISAAERDAALAVCHAAGAVTIGTGDAVTLTSYSASRVAWSAPIALLKLTSGTTAAPRAIRFRAEQLLADCTQICDTMGITERDLNFAVIPVSHSYGFSNLITPLLARGVSMVLSSDRMPRAVLDDLARSEATVFPGMPVFYQAFAEMEALPRLSHLRLCISAGAPLPLTVAQRFREKSGRRIHSFYGSSECGGICYDRAAKLVEPGFVGAPMSGVRLESLERNAGETKVRVRTAAAGDGYFPEAEEEKLRAGQFVPDDLLAEGESGFRIVGRISDVINVAGKKVNPAEVEAALLRCAGVRAAVVFGVRSARRNEEVAACVVADRDTSELILRELCRQQLSGWQVPKRIWFIDALPFNQRGKINRRALAEQYGARTFPTSRDAQDDGAVRIKGET